MPRKSKEVQGLLYKVAELETLVMVLMGVLHTNGMLSDEEVHAICSAAEIPEILGSRIKLIEQQGVHLIEARKKVLSEMLGVDTLPEEEPIIQGVLEDEGIPETVKDPDKKLH